MNSNIRRSSIYLALATLCLLICLAYSLHAAELPTVVVFAVGGTVASVPDPNTGALIPALTGEDLMKLVPEAKAIAKIKVVQFANILSTSMSHMDWFNISKEISKLLDDPEVAGVVMTHGTCTLEETAYFLDLTVKSDKPIICTGAELTAKDKDFDGPRNLLNAIKIAVSKEAVGKGTTLVLNNYINAARDVRKTHASNLQTFESGPFGYLGYVDIDRIIWYRASLRRQYVALPEKLPKVEMIEMYPGADGGLLRFAVDSGAEGIVISGVCAQVNCEMAEAVKYAKAKGIPIVLGSRIYYGRTVPLYGGCGGSVTLKELGCVSAYDLVPWKARILLMLALAKTKDPKEIQTYFDK